VRAGALVQLAASAPERSASQLNTLRRALDADWAVVLRALETGQPLVAADVSGRPAQVRALRALELEPRPVSARLGLLSPAEAERLPEAVSRSRVVRLALGPKTLLLVGVSSAEAERAARSTLRELGLRLADLLDAVAPPAAQAPAAPAARSGKPRRRPNRISLELGAGSTHDQLAVLAQHAVDLTRADGAAIAVLDERSNMVRYVAGCGEGFEHVTEVSFPVAQSLSGEASSHGRVLVVDDYRSHPLAQPFFLDLGVRSVAVVPMTTTPGAVAVHSINRPLRFGSSQVAAIEVIAQQAGALIAQGALYDELESSYRATVEALTNALEVKDSYTSQHVREIAELALAVGQRMQLRPRRLRDLEYAAILHDIGKIGLPTALLTKPGPLDVPERELVETHTAIGHAMLKDIPFLARVADIVRSAHERWDGQGYPDRLAGDRIPLESRIIFVCDAWHAMRSDRSYRRALPPEAARAELVRHAGAQFDPSVVDVFLQHVAEREVGAQRPES
jgi:HD-GYP domain-containing protein (c-di-GMP phosphodiesterase class II)